MASGLLVPEAHCGRGYFGRRVSEAALDVAADLRIREGLTTAEIGRRVGMAPATVSYHLGNIIREYPTMYDRQRRLAAERRWVRIRAEEGRRRAERERVAELRRLGRKREAKWLPLLNRAGFRVAARGLAVKELRWAEDDWEAALAEARELVAQRRVAEREAAREEREWQRHADRLQRRGQRAYEAAERLNDRVWRPDPPKLVHLDTPTENGAPWGELFLPAPNSDPFEVVVGNETDEILGDLGIEDVARLRDDELATLQERLLALGVGPRNVQQRERTRLREVEPRRGAGAPARHRSSMSTAHKHRKPGHQKSAGSKRGSRKQKKRWSREAA